MTNVVFVGEFLWWVVVGGWVGGKPKIVISDELIKNGTGSYLMHADKDGSSVLFHVSTFLLFSPSSLELFK